jgi:hypothetical protein
MSIAGLYQIPRTPQEVSQWVFDNATDHLLIINAIQAQKKQLLTNYVLDPLPQVDIPNWLWRHQTMHADFDGVLGVGGNDFSSLDFNDPVAVQYLVQLHFNEHLAAHTALGI